jgi:hypothetical protein
LTPCFPGLRYALHTEIRSNTNLNEGISSQGLPWAPETPVNEGVDSVEGT